MSSYKSCKKTKPIIKTVYSFNKKGKRIEKTVQDDDVYLLTLNNGSSIVVNKKTLSQLGISLEQNSQDDKKVLENSTKIEQIIKNIEENEDNFDNDDDNDVNNKTN